LIDVVLLAIGVLAIRWAYGGDAALWTTFLLVHHVLDALADDQLGLPAVRLRHEPPGAHCRSSGRGGTSSPGSSRATPPRSLLSRDVHVRAGREGLFELLGGRLNQQAPRLGLAFVLGAVRFVALGTWTWDR
jgi:hypothetical protein